MSKRIFDPIKAGLEEAIELVTRHRMVVFVRLGGSYAFPIHHDADLAEQGARYPGTLRIEDALTGEVLWSRAGT